MANAEFGREEKAGIDAVMNDEAEKGYDVAVGDGKETAAGLEENGSGASIAAGDRGV
eukprot:CAMPEP_0184679606 /NCGR_PEP_ID=MMETSP0312-20130426/2448_1 /TAXON_ID=31354 /ORGANISM="Compsopogon coeruleus, Strain SAG 36.94" /LENGTH=56 /DNA_ID=CAMNT_0027129159 /DNA_START=36 /DNA_END=207 /DNA_ORIENTATION=+